MLVTLKYVNLKILEIRNNKSLRKYVAFLRHLVFSGCIRDDIRSHGKSKLRDEHVLLGLMRVARFRDVTGNANSCCRVCHRDARPQCSLRRIEKRSEILSIWSRNGRQISWPEKRVVSYRLLRRSINNSLFHETRTK